MSRNWAVLLSAITFMSVGALLGAVIAPQRLDAARETERTPAPKGADRGVNPPRINYVNIAKVLREFERANAEGKKITAKRQECVEELKVSRDELARLNKLLPSAVKEDDKTSIQMKIKEVTRKIEDLTERDTQVMKTMTDTIIVEIYMEIHEVIRELAKEKGLDVVEAYPDAWNEEDRKKPSVAQVKLQTPALMPFFMREELDLTELVIERINAKYPPVPAKKNKSK